MRSTASWNAQWNVGWSDGRPRRLPAREWMRKLSGRGRSTLTLVNDLERSRVLYVAEDRTQASLDGFWETLSEEQVGQH